MRISKSYTQVELNAHIILFQKLKTCKSSSKCYHQRLTEFTWEVSPDLKLTDWQMARTELGQKARGQERDRNERKTSRRTDSRSVKQTERQTGVKAEKTERKRRQSSDRKLSLCSADMLGTAEKTFKSSSGFTLCTYGWKSAANVIARLQNLPVYLISASLQNPMQLSL